MELSEASTQACSSNTLLFFNIELKIDDFKL